MAQDNKKTLTPEEAAKQAALAGIQELPVGASLAPELVAALGNAIAMGMAMAKKMEQAEARGISDASIMARMAARERCEKCLQLKVACKGEHSEMVVWPIDPLSQQVFDGLQLNGVRYCSNGDGHKISVPAQNDFASMLCNFEKNERETRMGRKASRNGGSWKGGASEINHWR